MKEPGWVFALGAIIMLVVLGYVFLVAWPEEEQRCHALGGTMENYGRARLCLSPDGRVLRTE